MDESSHKNKTAVASTADEPEGKVLLVEPDHADVLASAESLRAYIQPVPAPEPEADEPDLHQEIWRYAKVHGIGYKQAAKRMFDERPKSKRPRKPKPVRG